MGENYEGLTMLDVGLMHAVSNKTRFQIEVRIPDVTKNLPLTHAALGWLRSKCYEDRLDFDIDLHGGKTGYSSFHFWDKETAFEFALACL